MVSVLLICLVFRTAIFYLCPRVLSRIHIVPPPTSYPCPFFLPASSTSPSSWLSVSSSLSCSYVLSSVLLLIFLPLSSFSYFRTLFSMFQLSRVGYWVFAISCAYFLSFPALCSWGSVPLTFILRLISRLNKLLRTIVSNFLLLSPALYYGRSIVFLP